MSGFAFGLIIGYLSWFAFKPGETPETVPLQKIAALLAVIGGATVLALFPAGTVLFNYYGAGLAVGFFFTPLAKWVRMVFHNLKNFIKRSDISRKTRYKNEIADINDNWLKIERLVRQKLETALKADERMPRVDFIDDSDLQELQYSQPAIEYVMRRFAQIHIQDGIEYKTWEGKPSLLKKRW